MAYLSLSTLNFVLECGHKFRIKDTAPPNMGEILYCYKCAGYRELIHADGEYSWKCRDCRANRGYGRHQANSVIGAKRHVIRLQTHVVDIFDGKTPWQVIRYDQPQFVDLEIRLAADRQANRMRRLRNVT